MGNITHFYNTADFSRSEICTLVDLAQELKNGKIKKNLNGKALAMLFFNPSLRTRVSFLTAMYRLGGTAFDLPIKDGNFYTFEFEDKVVMDKASIEHVKDAASVLSKYCDAIAIRASDLVTNSAGSPTVGSWRVLKEDQVLKSFMRYATVPIINMESNVYHPCQGLADAVTLKSKLGKTRGKKFVLTWVPHPKALPMATPNSQILAACDLGLKVIVVHPSQWELDKDVIDIAAKRADEAGGSLVIETNQKKALRRADFVCAKSWGALKYYGNWEEEKKIRDGLKHWIVDKEKMAVTDNAIFMHCLPVRRNVEVTDEVLDGKNSVIIDQAENRLWAQMAILLHLL